MARLPEAPLEPIAGGSQEDVDRARVARALAEEQGIPFEWSTQNYVDTAKALGLTGEASRDARLFTEAEQELSARRRTRARRARRRFTRNWEERGPLDEGPRTDRVTGRVQEGPGVGAVARDLGRAVDTGGKSVVLGLSTSAIRAGREEWQESNYVSPLAAFGTNRSAAEMEAPLRYGNVGGSPEGTVGDNPQLKRASGILREIEQIESEREVGGFAGEVIYAIGQLPMFSTLAGAYGISFTESLRQSEEIAGRPISQMSQEELDDAFAKAYTYAPVSAAVERAAFKQIFGKNPLRTVNRWFNGETQIPKGKLSRMFRATARTLRASAAEGTQEAAQGALLDTLANTIEEADEEVLGWNRVREFMLGATVGGVVRGGLETSAGAANAVANSDRMRERRLAEAIPFGDKTSPQYRPFIFKRGRMDGVLVEGFMDLRKAQQVWADASERRQQAEQTEQAEEGAEPSEAVAAARTEEQAAEQDVQASARRIFERIDQLDAENDPGTVEFARLRYNTKIARLTDPFAGATGMDWDRVRAAFSDEEIMSTVTQVHGDPVLGAVAVEAANGSQEARQAYLDEVTDLAANLGEGQGTGVSEVLTTPDMTGDEVQAGQTMTEEEFNQGAPALRTPEEVEAETREATRQMVDFLQGRLPDDDLVGVFRAPQTVRNQYDARRQEVGDEQAQAELQARVEASRPGTQLWFGDPAEQPEGTLRPEEIHVRGVNLAGYDAEGYYRTVARVFESAPDQSPLVPIEEVAEGQAKRFLEEGTYTMETYRGWKRQYEERTGQRTHGDSEAEVMEWLSTQSTAWAVGRSRELDQQGLLPSSFRSFLRRFRDFVRDVLRDAARLRKLDRDGLLPSDFRTFLEQSTLIEERVAPRIQRGSGPEAEVPSGQQLIDGVPESAQPDAPSGQQVVDGVPDTTTQEPPMLPEEVLQEEPNFEGEYDFDAKQSADNRGTNDYNRSITRGAGSDPLTVEEQKRVDGFRRAIERGDTTLAELAEDLLTPEVLRRNHRQLLQNQRLLEGTDPLAGDLDAEERTRLEAEVAEYQRLIATNRAAVVAVRRLQAEQGIQTSTYSLSTDRQLSRLVAQRESLEGRTTPETTAYEDARQAYQAKPRSERTPADRERLAVLRTRAVESRKRQRSQISYMRKVEAEVEKRLQALERLKNLQQVEQDRADRREAAAREEEQTLAGVERTADRREAQERVQTERERGRNLQRTEQDRAARREALAREEEQALAGVELTEARRQGREAVEQERSRARENRAQLQKAMQELEATVRKLPAPIRGKFRGFASLAGITTPEARVRYIEKAQARVRQILSEYNRQENRSRLDTILKDYRTTYAPNLRKLSERVGDQARDWLKIATLAADARDPDNPRQPPGMDFTVEYWGNLDPNDEVNQRVKDYLVQTFRGIFARGVDGARVAEALQVAQQLRERGRAERQTFFEERRLRRDQLKEETVERILGPDDLKGATEQAYDEVNRNPVNNLGRAIYKYTHLSQMSLELKMRALDRLGEDWMEQTFWRPIFRAQQEEESLNRRDLERYQEAIMRALGTTSRLAAARRITEMTKPVNSTGIYYNDQPIPASVLAEEREAIERGETPPDLYPAREQPMSRMQAISFYNALRDETLAGTWEAMRVEPETSRQEIRAFIGEEGVAIADILFEGYQEKGLEMQETFYETEGFRMDLVKNYGGRLYRVGDKAAAQATDSLLEFDGTSRPTLKSGSFKERVGSALPLEFRDASQEFVAHQQQMNHYIAFAAPVKEVQAVFGSDTVRRAIRQRRGKDFDAELNGPDGHFADIIRGSRQIAQLQGIFGKVRSNLSVGTLGLNVPSMIKQLTSVPAYTTQMPATEWARYSGQFWKNPVQNAHQILGTEFMRNRMAGHFNRDVDQALKRAETLVTDPSGWDNAKNRFMFLTRLGDAGAIVVGGWPIYQYHYTKALKEGKSEEEARSIAEEEFGVATAAAQQDSSIASLGTYQRGNELQRLFTMFLTSPIQYNRLALEALGQLVQSYGKEGKIVDAATRKQVRRKAVKSFFVYHVLLPQIFSAVSQAFIGLWTDDEERREEFWRNQLYTLLIGNLNTFFIIGEGLDYLAREAAGASTFFSSGRVTNPAFDSLATLTRELAEVSESVTAAVTRGEQLDWESLIDLTEEGVKISSGVPISPVRRHVENLYKVGTGEVSPAESVPLFMGWSEWSLGINN